LKDRLKQLPVEMPMEMVVRDTVIRAPRAVDLIACLAEQFLAAFALAGIAHWRSVFTTIFLPGAA
jgi:hypothetical protein